MTGMHQPCGEFVTADDILALQMWADDARAMMKVRMEQLDVLRNALIDIRQRFGHLHSGKLASLALQQAGEIAPSATNIITLVRQS